MERVKVRIVICGMKRTWRRRSSVRCRCSRGNGTLGIEAGELMKRIAFLLTGGIVAWSLLAQAPGAPELKPTDVVATVEGKPLTVADVNKVVEELPPEMRANYNRDPKGFLDQWFLLLRLSAMAEKEKLGEQSPFKESLRVTRMNVLAQATLENRSRQIEVLPKDLQSYYDS